MAVPPLRLRLDSRALADNFRWFEGTAGVPACPAIKADGYGLGADEVARHLLAAGARGFAVATWTEAEALAQAVPALIVLHGFQPHDAPCAAALPHARPVLNTPRQMAAWRAAFPGRVADLMLDTGMNRLGLQAGELGLADGIPVDTLHSHFACADEPGHPMTAAQIERLAAIETPARRMIANSAGACLGAAAAFDGTRPGLGLYGGVPHPAARVAPVVHPEALVVQVRDVPAGGTVGYGATWRARVDSRIAILNLGYADGLPRALGPMLAVLAGGRRPLAGRISMDLIAVDVTGADVTEGDWLPLEFDLQRLAAAGTVSQYELLTGLSRRYERCWT